MDYYCELKAIFKIVMIKPVLIVSDLNIKSKIKEKYALFNDQIGS